MQTAYQVESQSFFFLNPDTAFPSASQLNPPTKIPTIRSIVCMVQCDVGVQRWVAWWAD